jgi:hypothetical protein
VVLGPARQPSKRFLNKIDSFAPLRLLNAYGFLGVTIDMYSKSSFTSLKKLNVGILSINESFEELYLNNNNNVIPSNYYKLIRCVEMQ